MTLDEDTIRSAWPLHKMENGGTALSFARPGRDGLAWQPDSRHLTVGNVLVDLAGRRTGILSVPKDSVVVSIRPDGVGRLIYFPSDGDYALVDATGAVVHRIDRHCSGTPLSCLDGFLGWRTDQQILVWNPITSPSDIPLGAIDLRTGEREVVRHVTERPSPGVGHLIVIPADRLSDKARRAVVF